MFLVRKHLKRLKGLVEKKLNEFGLDWTHIVACTTDGASVMKRMENLMLPIHGICLSHAIHLAVCDTLYEKHSQSEDVQSEVDVAYYNESDEDLEMNDPLDVVD